jgi:CheY-like chemotaxis protein
MAKRILIADDEPNIVVSLEFLMKQRGYDIRVVSDGAEALKAVGEFHPDLILLDVMMPKMQGFDVLARLKSDATTRDIPVIMLSNLEQEAEVRRSIEGGARSYLVKSNVPLDELAERVAEVLNEKGRE